MSEEETMRSEDEHYYMKSQYMKEIQKRASKRLGVFLMLSTKKGKRKLRRIERRKKRNERRKSNERKRRRTEAM